jgi:alanine-glyoxylate transaminase/serine-glyoxylate transaminase/serine-pyruvate transaminase
LPLRLMIPGPVTVEDDVLHEMGSPVQAHYGPQWTAIYKETTGLLQQVFRTQGDVHILIGSGSAGLDAAVGSMTAPGDTILIGSNGFFGQRLVAIGQAYGLNVVAVEAPFGKPLEPSAFERALAQYPDAAAVVAVHLETSTTVLNPVQDIAAVARRHDVPVLVDAVSSLGGVPLAMDEWGIDVCMSASQKCLGAPPGLAPVAVSPRAWAIMDRKPQRQHGWYLNLQTWRHYAAEWNDWHPYPVTMATNNVLALRAGLRSLLADGLAHRFQRYHDLARRLRDGLRRLGLRLFTSEDQMAPILTAVYSPEGIPSSRIVNYLYAEHEIRISGGFGEELRDKILRIGHMGGAISEADIDAVLEGLAAFLRTSR